MPAEALTEPGRAAVAAATGWVLTEGHAGMESQAFGVAEALGLDAPAMRLRPRPPLSWLPGQYWPTPLWGIAAVEGAAFAPPWPDIAISCGRVAAPVCASLRRHGTRAIHVQNPRMPPERFDLILAARHDALEGPNVIVTRTALHRMTPQRLAAAKAAWADRLAPLRRPLVSVLLGGPNGRFRFGKAEGEALASRLAEMMLRDGVGVAVTPSRRTDPAVRAAMERVLRPLGAFVWDMVGDNPYAGLLAHADAIVVTCDSVSMLSEAAATSAPILMAELPGRSRGIGRFIEVLRNEGRARLFEGRFATWPVQPIDDMPDAMAEARRRLGLG